MIYLYYGKLGDGKTYHVVSNEILPALRHGRNVYTNIDGLDLREIAFYLNKPLAEIDSHVHIFEDTNQIIDMCQLQEGDKTGESCLLEKGSLVVVDEAQLVWNNRDFKNTKKEFAHLLQWCRHLGLDFVFVTQDVGNLEVLIRRMCNYAYQVKNMRLLSAFLGNRYIINVRQTPQDLTIMSRSLGSFDPKIFRLYRSMVETSRHKSSGAFLQVWWFWAIILVVGFQIFKSGGKLQTLDKSVKIPVNAQKYVNPVEKTHDVASGRDFRDSPISAYPPLKQSPEIECLKSGGRWSTGRIEWKGQVETQAKCRYDKLKTAAAAL